MLESANCQAGEAGRERAQRVQKQRSKARFMGHMGSFFIVAVALRHAGATSEEFAQRA